MRCICERQRYTYLFTIWSCFILIFSLSCSCVFSSTASISPTSSFYSFATILIFYPSFRTIFPFILCSLCGFCLSGQPASQPFKRTNWIEWDVCLCVCWVKWKKNALKSVVEIHLLLVNRLDAVILVIEKIANLWICTNIKHSIILLFPAFFFFFIFIHFESLLLLLLLLFPTYFPISRICLFIHTRKKKKTITTMRWNIQSYKKNVMWRQ